MKDKINNKAQGEIIGTVLLILIVVAAGMAIIAFVVPFVEKKLVQTGCLDVAGQITFNDNSKYTCYDTNDVNPDNNELRLQVHVGDIDESLEGFVIELGGASSKSYEIKDEGVFNDIRMFEGYYNSNLELPGKNEERTYVFLRDNIPDTVRVYPKLTEGEVCEVSDAVDNLKLCSL